MKLFLKFIFLPLLVVLLNMIPAFANTEELSLKDFLSEAEKKHPELESAQWREEVATAQLETYKAAILPSVEAGPLITRGKPGGSSVFAWNGNIGANFRSGQGFAGILKYTAWDFGRTSAAIRAGTADVEFAHAEIQQVKGETLLSLAYDYLECSHKKSLLRVLLPLKEQTETISTTIEKLVKTGQRTPVEAHLARAQTLDIKTQIQIAEERVWFHQKKLGIIIDRKSINCLDLEAISSTEVQIPWGANTHPSILSARARVKAAQERAGFARTERHPRLQLLGNGGYFHSPNLSTPWNYSVSAAFVIPIWDARIGSEIRRSEFTQRQAESDLRATELRMSATLIWAEEQYRVAEAQVHSLELEKHEAIRGFEIAKQRYQKSVGPLIELRETVRNLIRVSMAVSSAQAELLKARFLLNWYQGNQ